MLPAVAALPILLLSAYMCAAGSWSPKRLSGIVMSMAVMLKVFVGADVGQVPLSITPGAEAATGWAWVARPPLAVATIRTETAARAAKERTSRKRAVSQ